MPLELLKEEQERLGRELAGIQRQLDAYQADAKLVRAHVEQALDLLEDCYRLYMAAPDHLRKQLNQMFFERVLVNPAVDEDGRVILIIFRLLWSWLRFGCGKRRVFYFPFFLTD